MEPRTYEEADAERERLVADLDAAIAELVRVNAVIKNTNVADSSGRRMPWSEYQHVRSRAEQQRKDAILKKQQIDKRLAEIKRYMKANNPTPHAQQMNVVPVIRRLVGIIERLAGDAQLSELEQDVVDEAVEWIEIHELQNPSKYRSAK